MTAFARAPARVARTSAIACLRHSAPHSMSVASRELRQRLHSRAAERENAAMPRLPRAAETPRQRRAIAELQNRIRNAINTSSGRDRKLGVDPERLKWAMKSYGIDVGSITIRAQRLPAGSDLWADYKLWRDGELLFRLKLVPWDDRADARWHVKRHPDTSWWRRSNGRRR
jgi:hypothetical protein